VETISKTININDIHCEPHQLWRKCTQTGDDRNQYYMFLRQLLDNTVWYAQVISVPTNTMFDMVWTVTLCQTLGQDVHKIIYWKHFIHHENFTRHMRVFFGKRPNVCDTYIIILHTGTVRPNNNIDYIIMIIWRELSILIFNSLFNYYITNLPWSSIYII